MDRYKCPSSGGGRGRSDRARCTGNAAICMKMEERKTRRRGANKSGDARNEEEEAVEAKV